MLYKVGLFLKSEKQLTLLQHSIIRSTQIYTLTDRGLTFGITYICIKLYTLYTTHMVPYTPNYSPEVFLYCKILKVKKKGHTAYGIIAYIN